MPARVANKIRTLVELSQSDLVRLLSTEGHDQVTFALLLRNLVIYPSERS
jgi:hypothetical protein